MIYLKFNQVLLHLLQNLLFKMPLFKENSDSILTFLTELSDARRRVLFGDSERFKRWLKDNEIDDIVRI
jgi:hypothetical protein